MLDIVRRFDSEDERMTAARYASESMRNHPKRWPAKVCTWAVTFQHRAAPEPWQTPMIKRVHLDSVQEATLEDYRALLSTEGLELEALKLEWFDLTATHLFALLDVPSLHRLTELEVGNMDSSSTRKLPALKALEEQSWWPTLKRLELESVSDRHSAAMGEVLSKCERLTHLGFRGGMYEKTSWTTLFKDFDCPLKSIDFSSSYCSKAHFNALANLQLFDDIEELGLAGCDLGSAGLKVLCTINNTTLRRLDLGNNEIGSAGMVMLEQALFAPALRSLFLDDNSLRTMSKSIEALHRAHIMSQLEVLSMERTWLGPNSLKDLIKEPMPDLKVLDLSHNNIGKKGLEYLVDSEMPELLELTVTHNQLDPEHLEVLARGNWPKLRFIRIEQYDHDITEDVVAKLREGLGDEVEIHAQDTPDDNWNRRLNPRLFEERRP